MVVTVGKLGLKNFKNQKWIPGSIRPEHWTMNYECIKFAVSCFENCFLLISLVLLWIWIMHDLWDNCGEIKD